MSELNKVVKVVFFLFHLTPPCNDEHGYHNESQFIQRERSRDNKRRMTRRTASMTLWNVTAMLKESDMAQLWIASLQSLLTSDTVYTLCSAQLKKQLYNRVIVALYKASVATEVSIDNIMQQCISTYLQSNMQEDLMRVSLQVYSWLEWWIRVKEWLVGCWSKAW